MSGLGGVPSVGRLVARLRSLWRGVVGRSGVEAEMAEEFRYHLELRTEDLVRQGLAPAEAARRARLEFGHVEGHKEDARAARGLRPFDELRFSWLDVKLGLRMLVRYPGLTVVGGLGMAFAIFVGGATFEFIGTVLDPRLPLPDGERVVGLRYWDRAENERVLPQLSDLQAWSEGLQTVTDVGGFTTIERTVGGPATAPVAVARMSPSGFRVAGVAPLLGRPVLESDVTPGAAPVVVLGHDLWRTRFDGDTTIVGRAVRLGANPVTVVGVMPKGFGFPEGHKAWIPLSQSPGADSATGPVQAFGRLAPGATWEGARAEAAAIHAAKASEDPVRYGALVAEVLPYVESLRGIRTGLAVRAIIHQLNVFAALFLVLVSANVALLMFARAASREREILVRNALGASRARILSQLFAEALVLAFVASLLGLAGIAPALDFVYDRLEAMGGQALPFWYVPGVSATTVAYALLLTVLGAVVAGVLPALKVTGRGMQTRLRQAGAGAGGLRFGGVWTGVIVTQIAVTVVFTGMAILIARQATRSASPELRFPAAEYLAVRIEADAEGEAGSGAGLPSIAYAEQVRALERRLAEHPSVAAVALSDRLPLKASGSWRIELEGEPGPKPGQEYYDVSSAAVDSDFLGVVGPPLRAGRLLDSRDAATGARAVVVNESFVHDVLEGRNAVGRRLRYLDPTRPHEPGSWLEIVGVVGDLVEAPSGALNLKEYHSAARVFRPLPSDLSGVYPVFLTAHVQGDPMSFAPALHELAAAVAPTLRLHEPTTLDQANLDLAIGWRLYADLILVVSGISLLLALAGIYAVMSFTVARRTREVGVRVALGASASRVVTDVFRKPLGQLSAGVVVGGVLLGALAWAVGEGQATAVDGAILLGFTAAMALVCALAAVDPVLRALRIEPTEALKAEG